MTYTSNELAEMFKCLKVRLAKDEHDDFHGVVYEFFGAACLLGAIFGGLYWI